MMNSLTSSTQSADDGSGLISREIEIPSASDEYMLAELSLIAFFRESIARGTPLPDCIEGSFKILMRGKFEKGNRTATTVGDVKGSRRVGVRVGQKKKP